MTATLTARDRIEATARRRMAAVAALPRRGWDNERERADALAKLNETLDAWNEGQ